MLGDLGNLFQSFQKAQQELQKMQQGMQEKKFEGSAAGGKVTALVNGKQEVLGIHIDPELIVQDPDEIALLEDLVAAAANQALEKSREVLAQELEKMAGGNMMQNVMKMFQK